MTHEWSYIPVFKDNGVLMQELSDADFGRIIRAAINGIPTDKRPEDFSDSLFMLYKIFMSQVERVFSERESRMRAKRERRESRNKQKPSNSYQPDGIDPEEALRLALERSFGEDA
jgi:hypothetical protein